MQAHVATTIEELTKYRTEQNEQFEKVKLEFLKETEKKDQDIKELKSLGEL